MCGFWYDNTQLFSENNRNIEHVKRRGPESYSTLSNEFGNFGHALLSTVGHPVPQPINTGYGHLLYNGSTYNVSDSNDTEYIAHNLDDRLDNTIDVIRNLIGEYAIFYVTETHIVFCTDQWGTKNLWYYYNKDKKQFAISSVKNLISDFYGNAWPAEENQLYIINKSNFCLSKIINTTWNFKQKTNHFDYVFESFESAVKTRHYPEKTVYLLSSGHDSGVICCCANKLFGSLDTVTIMPTKENKKVLANRMKLHNANIVKSNIEFVKDTLEEMFGYFPFNTINSRSGIHLACIMKNYVVKRNKKLVVSGIGGDELYSDYNHPDENGRYTKIGKVWPEHLEVLFPWFNYGDNKLLLQLLRGDFISGHHGVEVRCPLLDQRLFQSWLNTTVELKNMSYKSWMEQYMRDNNYDYCYEKTGFGS